GLQTVGCKAYISSVRRRQPRGTTLFPYTTLFRSGGGDLLRRAGDAPGGAGLGPGQEPPVSDMTPGIDRALSGRQRSCGRGMTLWLLSVWAGLGLASWASPWRGTC